MADINSIAARQSLLDWFLANARQMPWRTPAPRDPYAVAVSEVMLQQTQVTTVISYFQRWMTTFPTWAALAEAPVDKVLKAWEGLGYYTRARNLHKLAQAVMATGGTLPHTVDALLDLPGIGPYSARSISSIAYGTPAACVDGNIVRVLSRLHNIDKTYKSGSAAVHDFQPLADEFLNERHPGDHNEAMMELGATICIKGEPRCDLCPLRQFCAAYAAGTAATLPRLDKVKIIPKAVRRLWVVREGRILLQRDSAAHGTLAGLYELPTPEALGVKRLPKKEILKRIRAITKYKITEAIYAITETDAIAAKAATSPAFVWASPNEIEKLPLSGPHAQWIKELVSRKTGKVI